MAAYKFDHAPVFIEGSNTFAVGATGTLRETADGPPVPVYDLNGFPLQSILVGPTGAHQAFTADIPHGVLDFGSTVIVAISAEALYAAVEVRPQVESALSQVETLQTSKAAVIHTHAAADITDFTAAVQAVPGIGGGGGGTGFIDGGTPTSTFSDTIIDGGGPAQ